MSGDEFDNLPDDFADISGVDWARILAGPSTSSNPASVEDQNSDLPGTGEDSIPIPSITTLASSSSSSTDGFGDEYDNFDPSLLAELDRIEEELTRGKSIGFYTHTHISSELLNFRLFSAVAPQPSSESTSDEQPSHYFSGVFIYLWAFGGF